MDLNVGMQAVVFIQAKEDVQMELVLETTLFVLEYVEMEFLQQQNNAIQESPIHYVAALLVTSKHLLMFAEHHKVMKYNLFI